MIEATLWQLLVGSTVDGLYRLTSWVGSGVHGAVYTSDPLFGDSSHRRIAIKLTEIDALRFADRIEALTSFVGLNHPSLLRSYTPGRCELHAKQFLYLPSELADETLGTRLYSGPLTDDEIRDAGICIASALVYLHSQPQPIVHANIKPTNVMHLGGRWKLGDYSEMYPVPPNGGMRTRNAPASPQFAAPECFDGCMAPAQDMWALGVLLHVAATGYLPFSGASTSDLVRSICTEPPILDNVNNDGLRDVIAACLENDPTVRLSAERALEALEMLDTGSSTWEHAVMPEPVRPQRNGVKSAPANNPVSDVATEHEPDADYLIVSATGQGDCAELFEAIQRARDNATIIVQPGIYSGPLRIKRPVTIQAQGETSDCLVSSVGSPAVQVEAAGVSIVGITCLSRPDSQGSKHPAIEILAGDLVVDNCIFTCTSMAGIHLGAGIAEVSMTGCTVRDCRSDGVVLDSGASLLFVSGTVANNSGAGIRLHSGSAATVQECNVCGCGEAGIVAETASAVRILNCSVFEQTGTGVAVGDGAEVEIAGCAIYSNQQSGVTIRGKCRAAISDTEVCSNILAGVAISGVAVVELTGCRLHDGRSNGISVIDASTCILQECEIDRNGFSGIKASRGCTLELRRCALHSGRRNAATIHDGADATFEDCDIYGNSHPAIVIDEGASASLVGTSIRQCVEVGILCSGDLLAQQCTFSESYKPGVEAVNGGVVKLIDCEYAGYDQPAVMIRSASEAVVERCHIMNNNLPGIVVGESSKAILTECTIESGAQMGVVFWDHAQGILERCNILNNQMDGVHVMNESNVELTQSTIYDNRGFGIHVTGVSGGSITDCELRGNGAGSAWIEQGCSVASNDNLT